jgi:hypothetical protein
MRWEVMNVIVINAMDDECDEAMDVVMWMRWL